MSLSEPLRASAQHIELLQDKRRRLSGALVSAELQFLAALRREFLDGEMTWAQLRDAYRVLSAARLPGLRARWMDAISVSPENVILNARREAAVVSAELKVLAALRDAYQGGEMTWAQLRDAYRVLSAARLPGLRARWMDAVPVSPENVILNARREAAGGAGGVWRGHSPLHRGEYYPPIGQRVVYVLFDAGRHAVYIRSTNCCPQRFADQARQALVELDRPCRRQRRGVRGPGPVHAPVPDRPEPAAGPRMSESKARPACSGNASGYFGSTTQALASVRCRACDQGFSRDVDRPQAVGPEDGGPRSRPRSPSKPA